MLMWSQSLQSTTIVATPITIVAKYHNCLNSNHKCHNYNHKCRNFPKKNFDAVNIDKWIKVKCDMFPWVFSTSALSFTIFSLFSSAKFPRYALAANNLSAETKSSHVLYAWPFTSPQFLLFLWKRETSQNRNLTKYVARFCNWTFHSLLLLDLCKKKLILIVQMIKHACS